MRHRRPVVASTPQTMVQPFAVPMSCLAHVESSVAASVCDLSQQCLTAPMRSPGFSERESFAGADLRQATFDGRSFKMCDFRAADLRGASLRNCYFAGCDLRDADLRGADLTDATCTYVMTHDPADGRTDV